MARIAFVGPQRKILRFDVNGKVVIYFDEVWKDGIQILPKDNKMILKMRQSRSKAVRLMAALILDANKGKNLEQYKACKTEEDVIELIRTDCKQKGLLEVS